MDRYAVIGYPARHSLSPRIHTAFAQATGAELGYEAIDVAPAVLRERVQRLHDDGFLGLNVTLPHKQAAVALAEELSDRARRAGAVNTLIRTADGWRADNTDGAGLLRDLQDNLRVSPAHQRMVILGAGGAARGILGPLLAAGPARTVVSNRSLKSPALLAGDFAELGTVEPLTNPELEGMQFDLVINATSAGHQGQVPEVPGSIFAPGALAYDLNYGPAARPFLSWAVRAGASLACDGLGMLVEQAAESFFLWRGQRPETAALRAALRAH